MEDIYRSAHFETIPIITKDEPSGFSPLILDLSGRCGNFVTPYPESKESIFWGILTCKRNSTDESNINDNVPSYATLNIGDYFIDGEKHNFDGYSIAFLRKCYEENTTKLQLLGFTKSCLRFKGRPLFGDVRDSENGMTFNLYSSSDALSCNLSWCCLYLRNKQISPFMKAISENKLFIRQQLQIGSESVFKNIMILTCGDETFFVYRSTLEGTFLLVGYDENETVLPIYAGCRSTLYIKKASINFQFLTNLVATRSLSLPIFLSTCLASKTQVMSYISNQLTPIEVTWDNGYNVILVDPDSSYGLQLSLTSIKKLGPVFTLDKFKNSGIVPDNYDFNYSILALKRYSKFSIRQNNEIKLFDDFKFLQKLTNEDYCNIYIEIDLYLLHLNLSKLMLSIDSITYMNLARAIDLIIFQSITSKNLQTMINFLINENACCLNLHYRLKCEKCLYVCLLKYYYGSGLTVGSFAAKISAKRTIAQSNSLSEILKNIKSTEIDMLKMNNFKRVKCFNYLAYQYHTRGFPEIRLSIYPGLDDISFNQLISQLYSPMSCHISFISNAFDYGKYGNEVFFKSIPWQMQFWNLRECLSQLFSLKRFWLLERIHYVLYMFFNIQGEYNDNLDLEVLRNVNWKTEGLDILTGPPTSHTRAVFKRFNSSSNYIVGEDDLLNSAKDLDEFIDLVDNPNHRTPCSLATEDACLITNVNVPIGIVNL